MHCFAALWLVNWDLHQVAVQVPASACTAKAVIQKHLFLQMSLCLSWFSNLTSSHFSPRPQLQTQHPCFTSVCDKDEVSTRRVEEEERIWSSWSPSPTSIWVLWHCYGGKMFFNCSQRKQRWKCHTVRYKRCLFFFLFFFWLFSAELKCVGVIAVQARSTVAPFLIPDILSDGPWVSAAAVAHVVCIRVWVCLRDENAAQEMPSR